MSTRLKWLAGTVAIAIALIGIAGIIVSLGSTPALFPKNAEMVARLETARVLFREIVVIPVGPVTVEMTPFHLAHIGLTIGLACFAGLVCLVNYLFSRRRRHRLRLNERIRNGFSIQLDEGFLTTFSGFSSIILQRYIGNTLMFRTSDRHFISPPQFLFLVSAGHFYT